LDSERDRPTDPPRRPRERLDGDPSPAGPGAGADDDRDDATVELESKDAAPKPKKRRRVLRWLVGIVVLLLMLVAMAGGFAALYWERIARAVIVSQAESHGAKLEFATLELVRNGMTIERAKLGGGVKLSLASMPGVEVSGDALTIELSSDLAPVSVSAKKLRASFASAPGVTVDVARADVDVADFAPRAMTLQGVDVTADDVHALIDLFSVSTSAPLAGIATTLKTAHVRVKRISSALPEALALDVGEVKRSGDAMVLVSLKTKLPILDLDLELASLELRKSSARLSIVIPTAPELTIDVLDRGRRIDIGIARVPGDLLATKLGWSRPPDFALSARASLALPEGAGASLSGSYDAVLEHYVPPHPRELDGIVFGDSTKASGAFRLEGAQRAALTDLRVEAGSLVLKGKGSAEIPDGGKLTLSLDGSIACSELAASAVGSHFGFGAALLTNELTRGRLGGSVSVHLGVVIDGKDAAHPEVHPAAAMHCGVTL
jgi:hypothetical protein